jgi:tetratricopeptide (TPR) repeat protein
MFDACTLSSTRRLSLFALAVCAAAAGCSTGGGSGVPEEVIRTNILGTAYLGQTKWVEAEAEFRRALALRPDDPLLLTNTALALLQQEETDEAMELLERAVAADAGYTSAHFNMGLIENRSGNFERAVDHFARAVELDPNDLFARYYLGTSLARIDREPEAIDALRAALERDPTHVSTLYALGRLLLQQGKQESGMQMITRSQEIRARSGLDEAVGSEYGEQGRLSRATDYPGGALEAPEPIPVQFEATVRVGLDPGSRGIAWTLVPSETGVALLVAQRATVLQLLPPGRSEPVAATSLEGAEIAALAAGDADNDGHVDVAALLALPSGDGERLVPAWFRRSGEGATATAPPDDAFSGDAETRLDTRASGLDLTFVDRDHDGDLDLFWCWSSEGDGGGCNLATNDGEGRFDVQASTGHGFDIEAPSGRVAVAFSDIDNDRDLDLLVAEAGGLHLLSNQRDGSFDDISEAVGLAGAVAGVHALAVADLNKDGWMDLLVGRDDGVRLLANRRGRFDPPSPLTTNGDGAGDVVVLDFDNDGFLDVAGSSAKGLLAYHNRGAERWQPRPDLLKIEGLNSDAAPLAGLDADGDGDLDLAVADGTGTVSLLVNQGGNAHRWIDLDSEGVGDNRFGIGAKVEVLAGALRQKFEVTRPVPVHVGLGGRERVQAARYLWPSGVLQDEIDLGRGAATKITQLDRKGTSCPLLYAWRDGGWHFVTDFLGGAAVGYQVAPGVFSTPDTDEYVRVDGGLTEDGSGRLRLRLNNQLEEVIWFDQAELIVVDHPAGTVVHPNERLMPGPPYPEYELFASSDVRPLVSALGVEDASDLTERLSASDGHFVDNFELLRPKGYAESHTLEMDIGPFDGDARVVLLLDGWIDYADSSSNLAAAQAGLALVPPRLHVADGRGGWTDVSAGRMGFPAGLPKTMAVEVSGLFPTPDHRVRIETNMRIYWDRARVMIGGEDTPLEVTRLKPLAAELRFGGFPRPTRPHGGPPLAYDPDRVEAAHQWKAHVGLYTGFGDVTALLDSVDDRFVTTRNGDEIELSFRAPGPVPPGHARTYLLFADGFGKDMDPNSQASNEVGPIPFHGMPGYPYPADLTPAAAQDGGGLVSRRVAPSAAGWPGALPLGRHAER